MKSLYLLIATMLVLASCSTTEVVSPTEQPTLVPTEAVVGIQRVCLVTNEGGSINDGTFNQYAYEGMMNATTDYGLAGNNYYESTTPEDYPIHINSCIENGADAIITVGYLIEDAAIAAALANPDLYFIGVDQSTLDNESSPENFVGLQFREDEAGFLVGALAALVANENDESVIAGVYGVDIPAVKRFRNGYEQGALYVNPDWQIGTNILGEYGQSFIDTELGEQIAAQFINDGAFVIFGAGGPLGSAGITFAAQQGTYVIGVDQDEFYTTFRAGEVEGSEYLISSALKRVDQGVYDMIAILAEGRFESFPSGTDYLLDATRAGIGFALQHEANIPDNLYDQVSDILQGLVSGEIQTNVDTITGDVINTDN